MAERTEAEKVQFWADIDSSTPDGLESLGHVLQRSVTDICEAHSGRINTLVKAVSMYDNTRYENLIDAAMNYKATDWREDQELTFNALRSVVATLNSKISKNKILPRIVTTNARWSKREQASRIDKYIRGLFYQLNCHARMEEAMLHALISGDGFVKVCNDGKDVWVEHVLSDELYVDYLDGMYGNPSAAYQTRVVNLRSLLAEYPDSRKELEELYNCDRGLLQVDPISRRHNMTMSCCVVIEAWSLPQGELPGRHVISVGSHVLADEEWDREYLPFIHLQYSKPERGYYSKGLYHELAPIQREITKVLQRISDAQRLLSAPKIFLKRGANIPEAYITNEIGTIIPVESMSDFQVYTPPPMNGESFNYLAQLVQKGYEQTGVSQMSASSRLPAGIDGASGKALREFNDIETERFALLAQEWERGHKEIGDILLKEISKNNDFLVKSFDRNAPMEEISFKDLGIKIDDVCVSIFPVSALPSRPEAKFAAVNEYIQSGFVDASSAMELLDIPDLDAYSEIKNAPKKAVDRVINSIIDEQKYINPEPMMDLEYLKIQATLYYNRILGSYELEDDTTQVILDQMRQLLEDTAEMLKQPEPAQPEGVPGLPPEMGGLPPGITGAASPTMTALSAGSGAPLPPGMSAGPQPGLEALAPLEM